MAKKKDDVVAGTENNIKKDVLRLNAIIEKEFDEIQDVSKIDTSVKQWYSWGNYALNYISTKNLFRGVAAGRITSAKGLSSTGKSLLFASVAKDPNVDVVIAIEAEGAGFTKELFEFAGGDVSKFKRVKCSTFGNYKISKKTGAIEEISDDKFPVKKETDDYLYVEGATRAVKRLINQIVFNKINANMVIILDSLANIQSVREKAGTCFPGDTSVITNTGVVKISDIKKGNLVLTHLGTFEEVKEICSYEANEKSEIIELETHEGDVLKMTPNHPVLVRRFNSLVWVKAEDLTEDDELQKIIL